jgi:hypothetical protein
MIALFRAFSKREKLEIAKTVEKAWAREFPECEFMRQMASPYKNMQLALFIFFMHFLGYDIVMLLLWLAWWFAKLPLVLLYKAFF